VSARDLSFGLLSLPTDRRRSADIARAGNGLRGLVEALELGPPGAFGLVLGADGKSADKLAHPNFLVREMGVCRRAHRAFAGAH